MLLDKFCPTICCQNTPLLNKRIVQTVRVAVEALRIFRHLHVVVGREEAAQQRVVQPAVHVDDADFVEHLVPRVASAQSNLILRHRLATPCVVRRIEDTPALCIHNGQYAPDIVCEGKKIFK